jgi:Uma2 family endonuclease
MATAARPDAPLLEPDRGRLTVDDWLALPETADRYELYDGMLVMAPPPGGAHQAAATFITHALTTFAFARGGLALTSTTGVKLSAIRGFEPDALYLSPTRMDRFTDAGIEGAPDIVVEVLSPSTRTYDLATKLPAYLAAGVREVWIVDLEDRSVAVHTVAGRPPAVAAFGEQIPSTIVDVGSASLERLPEPRRRG